MATLPRRVQQLIDAFKAFPGIGPKTAERFVFFLLRKSPADRKGFAETIAHLGDGIVTCSLCHDIGESDPCAVCTDRNRDGSLIAVVATSAEKQAIEKTGTYHGQYHILGGVLNPIEGVTPESLTIGALFERIRVSNGSVREILLALNADLEGESTSLYLAKELKALDVKVTRLARGLPMGSDLEYADEVTLQSAIENRRELS